MNTSDFDFYRNIEPFDDFEDVLARDVYERLPDDWLIAVTDVEQSTKAIAEGRYKAVNMAGAAGIAAVTNAIGTDQFPFVFGGDGTAMAIPPSAEYAARKALAATRVMARQDMDLGLRVGMVPVRAVRENGHDVRIARYRTSEHASFAMFTGNGIAWCEDQLKAGNIDIVPAPDDARPDLTGLSCRWAPIEPANGKIVSVLAMPRDNGAAFAAMAKRIIHRADQAPQGGRPVDTKRIKPGTTLKGLFSEARITRGAESVLSRVFDLLPAYIAGFLTLGFNRTMFGFDPDHYRDVLVANTDFRKFDDGLRMTVDCDDATLAAIQSLLQEGAEQGILHFGLHAQDQALMTCIVPSAMADDHIHFIDGASGGYAQAAVALKRSIAAAA